ncbi:hypothetical protein TVAG_051590 [Trichomonas vaginalis G3]|uniref:Uncharacterized protein n=1 Tax=Trichomonas vaginalis (strain ATCC PRA-98 / G3) TaxID=412133 RepID=A2EZ94_TRIV3|nr:hypothetical protein TVAGG3_0807660 [Trichomonas vaginalis G3]EAY02027.1 hypothetical protein TVAG_051590 [Trichomonas vaginalis G3]KAI5496978.1 hypothetical protein TVAGG3_0807660 [Trichomonas vaginalis G3]|eukprot:XP_001330487.1 hypothetical protein [Trichomonas vaginalis G3]
MAMVMPPDYGSGQQAVATSFLSESDSYDDILINEEENLSNVDQNFFISESDEFVSESDVELDIISRSNEVARDEEPKNQYFIESDSSDFDFESIISNSLAQSDKPPIIIKNPPIATAALKTFLPDSSDSDIDDIGSTGDYENTYETTNSTVSTTSYTNSTTTTTSTYTASTATFRSGKSITAASGARNFFFESDSN